MLNKRLIRSIILFVLLASYAPAKDMNDILRQRVSPSFVGISLENALRVFANQYALNMIISGDIRGTVTVQLTDVALEDALNIILRANGCHFIVENNVILVKSFAVNLAGELSTKIYQLKYVDGFRIVKTLEPLLSAKGKIDAMLTYAEAEGKNPHSNMIIVNDVWDNIRKFDEVISQIDQPESQIQIEVRLVERIAGDEKRVGIDYPKSFSASMLGAETNAPITKSGQSQSGGEQTILSAWFELPKGPEQLNLGVISFDQLKATMDILATDNNSRLVSNPKVTTLNYKKAVIKIGTTIPVPEISRGISGDLFSYKEKDVNMTLEVTPMIGDSGNITLDLHPVLEEIVGYTGSSEAPQPITSKREVQTTVLIQDGETVVIGGLIKESRTENIKKIWLLGDIPLLGYLFRHTSIVNEKKDLMIFITSKVM